MESSIDDNVRQVRNLLDKARKHADEFSVDFNLREFWANVREINELFKTLSPLPHSACREVRAVLNDLCQKAKTIRQKMDNDSRIKREMVEHKIDDAVKNIGGDEGNLQTARQLLNTALEWMKNGWDGFDPVTQLVTISSGKMNRHDHDACREKWRAADRALRDRKLELAAFNYEWIKSEAYEASGHAETDPKRAKQKVQAIQAKMRGRILSQASFQDIRHMLDRIWERASKISAQRHRDWENRQKEWQERRVERQDRIMGHIKRKRGLIEDGDALISRLMDQIDYCRELEAGARTEEYANEVRRWIEEKSDIIESKRRFIAELEDQIGELEAKLDR